jgi:uncharacterized protein
MSPRSRTAVLGAFALLALHVLDEAFVDPRPGTAASDHLVSGLVPLALLAAGALTSVRARPGAGASIAAVFGALALTAAGVDATRRDAAMLLSAAAGVTLLGVAAATLWTSRRSTGTATRRALRRLIKAAAAAGASFLLVYPLGLSYVATHASRQTVPAPTLGVPHREVAFRTSDGLRLAGWYVPSRNRAAVIVSPGRSRAVQRHAAMLIRHGYGVLIFDRRGEGQSDGDSNLLGWDGEKDLTAGLHFLQSRADVDRERVGGLGLSVGGEMLLQTAAHSRALAAVVSEGAGIRSFHEASHLPWRERWFDASFFAVATTATAVLADDVPPPSLTDLVARSAPRPIFLIAGGRGQANEKSLNPLFYAAAGTPKTLWVIPEAAHTGGLEARPREYERRVIRFFDDALSVKTRSTIGVRTDGSETAHS